MKDKEVLREKLCNITTHTIMRAWYNRTTELDKEVSLKDFAGWASGSIVTALLKSEEAQAIFLELIDAGLNEDSLELCNKLLDKEIASLQERIEELENTEKK